MSDNAANSVMLHLPPPVGLEKIGRIHDWAYLERRNRSLTDMLWTIGQLLKHVHDSIQPQMLHNLSSYMNMLQTFEEVINFSEPHKNKSSIVSIQELIHTLQNITQQYSELSESLSQSFFSVLVVNPKSTSKDNIVDDFYVRCANDILRHNGTYMKQFYLKTTQNINSMMASLNFVDNLSIELTIMNITNISQNYHDQFMIQNPTSKALIEQINNLKENYSLMYKMYMDVYATAHADSALLNTKDWSKVGQSEDFYRRNYVQLNIFYDSLSTTTISQFETDSVTSLICDLGGNIGLWLGGSILTLFEILDLMLVIFKRM